MDHHANEQIQHSHRLGIREYFLPSAFEICDGHRAYDEKENLSDRERDHRGPPARRHWQVSGNWTPTLPPLEFGMVPVTTCPTVSVKVTDWPPTATPKFQ